MTDSAECQREEFREFCGGSLPVNPTTRLIMFQRFKAGAPASNGAANLRKELTIRFGEDSSRWPTIEQAKLARLESGSAGLPRPIAPTSAADLAKHPERELEALEKQLADAKRIRPTDTFRIRQLRDDEVARLQDRISGIRRRQQAS